jgi:type I restriction enzyme S subunit
MGKVAIAGKTCVTNQQINSIIINKNHCAKYVYYNLSLRKNEIKGMASGSAVPILNKNDFAKIPIYLPSLLEQQAISGILGSLDDMIELNRQMNETLEAMARAIFKSWFVDFDPVRAKAEGRDTGLPPDIANLFPASFEDSELGLIPKGWDVVLFSKAFIINPLRTLKNGTIAPYLDMKNMPTKLARPQSWVNREYNSGSKFMNGDTLVARITPCLENGKTAFIDFLNNNQIGWGSTEYIVIRSKPPLSLEYSYFFARTTAFRTHAITNMTGSSGRQRVQISCFNNFNVVVPPCTLAEYFGKIAAQLMSLMKTIDEETVSISKIRDELLPKLISGEIRVPDAEKFIKDYSPEY